MGDTTHFEWDSMNDLTRIVDAAGGVTSFAYDDDGDVESTTDANGHTTSATWNSRNQLSEDTDALGHSDSYGYDGNGDLTQWTDRKGQVTTYAYDALNRMTLTGFGTTGSPPNQSYQSSISYKYDAGNRLVETSDSSGETTKRTWDGLNELVDEEGTTGAIAYEYDGGGRRISAAVSGQSPVSYTYDNANRLTGVTREGGPGATLGYYNNNQLHSVVLPDGIEELYAYDSASQLTAISYMAGGSALGELAYAYDAEGRRTAIWGSFARLNLPAAVSATEYNADNQLVGWGTRALSYDANGNLSSEGANSYTWNARDQLTGLSNSEGSASFSYDVFGRRTGTTIGGTTTNYLYDGQNVVEDLVNGTPKVSYLLGRGLDSRFARTESGATQSFLTDALGSTIALADASQSISTTYTYEPFGRATLGGSASPNKDQYTGRENDGTGLQFNRARYYSPETGRFISEDPARGLSLGTNTYSYGADNPMRYRDPMGLCAIDIACGLQHEVENDATDVWHTVEDVGEEGWSIIKKATPIGCFFPPPSQRKDPGERDGEPLPLCVIEKAIKDYVGCREGAAQGSIRGGAIGAAAGPEGVVDGIAGGAIAGCVAGGLGTGASPVNPLNPSEGGP
jgi:RHS repeat-associated protein